MIAFVKAHAYGNDFLYVRAADVDGLPLNDLAREMCARHTGIGADGLIVYEVYEARPQSASMRLFNADGGRAEVSGNGVRGLAALLLQGDRRDEGTVVIETEGGTKRLTRTAYDGPRQTFCASMGKPEQLRRERATAGGEDVDLIALSIGNPQAIVLGPLPDDARFERLGAALERHALFPDRTNVEFVQVEAPDRLRIRIWERGVGPSWSSGTGSCASLVAAAAYGGAARDAEVIAPGGSQRVEWRDDGVYLTGWAEVLCDGIWRLPPPSGVR